jgi:hypothetical protein
MVYFQVNDLRAQLDLNKPSSSTARDVDDLEAEFMGSAVSVRDNRRDDRQKNEIRRIERERKEQQEVSEKQLGFENLVG